MFLTHKIERKGDRLRVTVEIPLASVVTHLRPKDERLEDPFYRRVVSYLLKHVPDDVWDVAEILHQEGEEGHVKWFDDQRGFGFIRTYDREDVFVHHSQIEGDGYQTLAQGQRVRFRRRFVMREGREVVEAISVEPIESKV